MKGEIICTIVAHVHFVTAVLIAWGALAVGTGRTTQKPRVLVIGGSGRVGGSSVRALSDRYGESIELRVGGRTLGRWNEYESRLGRKLPGVEFESMDINSQEDLNRIIPSYDLVIHTAGPFQGLFLPSVMDCCIKYGSNYLDVCDDVNLSRICRSSQRRQAAKTSGSIAVISTGIWPGGSSLFAQEVIDYAGGKDEVDKVEFSFFTAGSGNAGPTILTATFLILGEDVLTYVDGKEVFKKSATELKEAEFGEGIGIREVVRLNLIECESCFQSTGIKNVDTRFGTAPKLWNRLFALMAQVIPQRVLKDRTMMTWFANFSLPLVRIIDTLVGSTNGIRVDVTTKSGVKYYGLLTHKDLEKSVGDSIAAFATQLLKPEVTIPPGIYFPEEVPSIDFRRQILADISHDALTSSISVSTSCTSLGQN